MTTISRRVGRQANKDNLNQRGLSTKRPASTHRNDLHQLAAGVQGGGTVHSDALAHRVTQRSMPRLISLAEVMKMTALGRTSIYMQSKAGTFPRVVKIGSASRWVDAEVVDWIQALMSARGR